MSNINRLLNKVKSALDGRRSNKGRKRKPGFVTSIITKATPTTTVTLTSTLPVTMTTVHFSENITDFSVTVATVGKARMSGDMELLSLTEIMAVVAGVVGLIILSTLACFVYRTKCRNVVRMRKTGVGERRSGAMSLDLMEMSSDQRLREMPDFRLPPAFTSPMYGRAEESGDIIFTRPNGNVREISDANAEDGGYYSVALNESNEHDESDNEHDNRYTIDTNKISLSGRNLESFKGKKTNHAYENVKTEAAAKTDKADADKVEDKRSKKKTVNADEIKVKAKRSKNTTVKTNEGKVKSKKFKYENVPTDENMPFLNKKKSEKGTKDFESTKITYENVDLAGEKQHLYKIDSVKGKLIEDELEENFHEVDSVDLSSPPTPCSHGSYVNVSTDDTTGLDVDFVAHGYINTDFRKQSMPIMEQVEEKDNSKRSKLNVKNRRESKDKQAGPAKNIDPNKQMYVDKGNDYLPMNTPTMTNEDVNYLPMNSPTMNNVDIDYMPMNSPPVTDTDYVPMDIDENGEELVADNVYIYMENGSPSAEYMNSQTVRENSSSTAKFMNSQTVTESGISTAEYMNSQVEKENSSVDTEYMNYQTAKSNYENV